MNKRIPQNWERRKLDELGFVGRGRSRRRPRNDPSLYGGDYPFFQTGDIKKANLYLYGYNQTYNEKGLSQSKLWDPGTLCITIAANIAETAIMKIRGCFPDSVVGFVPDISKTDVRYVKYYIDTIKIQMQSASLGTTQDNLSLDKLLSFDILTPPLSTQKKIAFILSSYDDLIENNTRRIKILEEMAQSIYREWFVNFRFPGHEKVKMVDSSMGKIPEGWNEARVEDLYQTASGGTPSRKVPEYFDGAINWVKTQELRDCFIFETEEKISEKGLRNSSAKVFPENTVLIAMYGATIGQLAILARPSATNQACCALTKKNPCFGHSFAFLSFKERRADLINLRQGAAQQNVNQIVIKGFKIVKPKADALSEFNSIADPMLDLIKNLQRRNFILRQTRDLLLPKLISGELDVSELDIRTAENVDG